MTCTKKHATTAVRNPNRPAYSKSQYRLRYPGSYVYEYVTSNSFIFLSSNTSSSFPILCYFPVSGSSVHLLNPLLSFANLSISLIVFPFCLPSSSLLGISVQALCMLRFRQAKRVFAEIGFIHHEPSDDGQFNPLTFVACYSGPRFSCNCRLYNLIFNIITTVLLNRCSCI